jgi:malate synthase
MALEVRGVPGVTTEDVLTPDALGFVERLAARFAPRIEAALEARKQRQAAFDRGVLPDFLPETEELRRSSWTVAPIPADLRDRRVEITGPVTPKMVINALNSGARVFMADFEDATSPTWESVIVGQRTLAAAIRRTLEFTDEARGKQYALAERVATLMVRPRGLHLVEAHLRLDGRPIPGALVDFGLYFFHNARELLARGSGPYFYLPKLQSHLEARIWAEVFAAAERELGVPHGSVRATVLIETLPAAFEMDEILWELRDYSAGLNCGRWDYIFSFIKTLRADPTRILPDRSVVGMTQPFMAAYTARVIQVCHRRGIHAMGGMAAQIPLKDPVANEEAMQRVRADKEREVRNGHDGTWVAHPGLVSTALEIFDAHMPSENQITRQRDDVHVTAADLLAVPEGPRTMSALRHNVRIGVQYLAAWLEGLGCVPLYGLMEDAATAEISRASVWQWQHHGVTLDDGTRVDAPLIRRVVTDEVAAMRDELGTDAVERDAFVRAVQLFERMSTSTTLEDFLTLPAYQQLVEHEAR